MAVEGLTVHPAPGLGGHGMTPLMQHKNINGKTHNYHKNMSVVDDQFNC